MGYTKSPINEIDIPDSNELLNQVGIFTKKAVEQGERFSVMRFDSQADLQATLVGANAPAEGMVAWMKDSNILQVFNGTTWVRVYPVERQIHVGTTTPVAALGAVGDIYLQY